MTRIKRYVLTVTSRTETRSFDPFTSVEEAKEHCPDLTYWRVWGTRNPAGNREWMGQHISGTVYRIEEIEPDQVSLRGG